MAKLYAVKDPAVSEREARNMAWSRRIATQGMVLLKNDGILPLTADGRTLAVFGNGVRRTVKGGSGSGDVNSRMVYSVEQGLTDAGFTVGTTAWLDCYDKMCEEHMAAHMARFTALITEKGPGAILDALTNPYHDPDVPEITEQDMEGIDRDCAIYVIARTSGEGSDRKVAPGDYELSEGEISNLNTLTAAYHSVIVVLNVGGVIDTKFLRSKPEIRAILLMSQAGNIGGLALADVLTGKVSPCGHLAATWAENYIDYPSADTFSYRNGNVADEYYQEGIFVGYRYFDSFDVKPAYPFGYGLSYTSFALGKAHVSIDGADICVRVPVKNTGRQYSGKEVVQIYVSQPEGRLPKPCQVLSGYGKTCELAPGTEECVTVRFPVSALASYDEEHAAWVLESGTYYVRVGTHSRNTRIAAALRLDRIVIVEQLKNQVRADCALTEIRPDTNKFYSYPNEVREKETALTLDLIAAAIPTSRVC